MSQPEQVRILRIVVASPSDVQPEREAVPRVAEELNHTICVERGVRLEVYRWEMDTYPGFNPRGPQGLIDSRLEIQDCAVLLGIFWKRLGTPVDDAPSGTVHEFLLAYQAWKEKGSPHIMCYFKQRPFTAAPGEEENQQRRVREFKEQFPAEGMWWQFTSEKEFEKLVQRHLTQFILDRCPSSPHAALLAALHQLPPSPGDFTGREDELRELMEAVETGGAIISGMVGMGAWGRRRWR